MRAVHHGLNQQRFNQAKRRQQKARLALQRRRLQLKEKWLKLRRRINRWLHGAVHPNTLLTEPVYEVKGRVWREKETRVSER